MSFLSSFLEIVKSDWLLLIALFVFSYFIRALFLTIGSGDLNYTLYQFKKTRINKFGQHWAKDSVVEGIIAYPTLLHWFYARIPTRFRLQSAYFMNTAFDCVSVVLFYLFCRFFLGGEMLFSLLFAIAFSTCPLFFPITERLKNFGGRTFGVLVFMLLHACFFIAFTEYDWRFYALSAVLCIVVILSSWFAMQAMVFSFLFLSLFYMSVIPVAFLSSVFITGMVIPGLGIRTILIYKINQSIWYWRNYSIHKQTNSHNSLKGIFRLPYNFFHDQRQFWLTLFYHNGFFLSALSLLVIPLAFYFANSQQNLKEEIMASPILKYSLYLTGTMFLSFIITGIRPFIIFGQNERYLEYAAPFIYLLFGFIAIHVSGSSVLVAIMLLIIYQMSLIMTTYIINIKYLNPSPDTHLLDQVAGFINKHTQPLRILFYPAKNNFELSYYTNNPAHRFYYMFVTENKITGMPVMESDLIRYNDPITDFHHFKNKYQINTFVVDKTIHSNYLEVFLPQSSDVLFENSKYIVFFKK